jgi:hypothetical protein
MLNPQEPLSLLLFVVLLPDDSLTFSFRCPSEELFLFVSLVGMLFTLTETATGEFVVAVTSYGLKSPALVDVGATDETAVVGCWKEGTA